MSSVAASTTRTPTTACRLSEVLAALSLAADVSAALPPDTSLRTCLVALGVGRAHGLGEASLADVFVAGLLRHIGCTSSAHEETRVMGDDMELKGSLALVHGGSPLQIFNGARRGFGRGKPWLVRARLVTAFMASAPKAVPAIFGGRCEVARRIADRLALSPGVVRALDETYERFDGKGPTRRGGDALSTVSQVLAVGEVAALFLTLPGGDALALEMVQRRAGGQLAPALAACLVKHARDILPAARGEGLWSRLLAAEPKPWRMLDDALDRELALVLADVADLKSTFTLGHSRAVAALTERAAQGLGLDPAACARAARAALLHDIGRVSVSNAIWDKPGALDDGEWEKVRLHPYHTERIVRAATPWSELSLLASSDHERAGAHGYPRGTALGAHPEAAVASALAAADRYCAMTEPRPHRPALAPERAADELAKEIGLGHLDRRAASAVLDVAGHARAARASLRVANLTEREREVVVLLARGLVDKEIAAELGVSPRTVHHHNQHIYDKIGVRTRSGVALWAIENGLM